MADNQENRRNDDIFDIMNELHGDDDNRNEASQQPSGNTVSESGSHVDEILQILNSDKALPSNEDIQPQSIPEEEAEIPDSIFDHLSNEDEVEISRSVPNGVEGNLHFTDDAVEDAQFPAEDEDSEDEDEDEEEVRESKLSKAARFIGGMSFIPKAIIYIVIVVILSIYLSYYIITIGNDVFALVTDSREVTVTIEEGATDETVAAMLKEKGIIEYDWVYELYMKYRGDGDSTTEYIVGEHTLNLDFNYSQIITNLTSPNVIREVKRVTIPEGYTVDQIIDLLIENGIGQREDYVEAINNYPYKWEFVELLDEMGYSEDRIYRLEGYLYPDTYEFYTTEDEVYVINKMLAAFSDKFWEDFTRVDDDGYSYQAMMLEEYGMTFDDCIVFASLVQSEGGTATDFYYVSYVFHNRLSHPASFPKLESDATIQYVLPERVTDSTQLDVSYETPYNTYLYDGLPPGAISNPGTDALSATLFPEMPLDENEHEIDAYFFVANNAGKTYYSASRSGHDNNKLQVKVDNEAIEAGTYEG